MSSRCFGLLCVLIVLAPVQAAEKAFAPSNGGSSLPPRTPAPSRPRLFVLAIGINAYPGKDRLSFAVKDARTVAQTLRAKGRKAYGRVEAKLLTDQAADRRGILDGIAWLEREVTPRDTAVIFYSGHGARHPGVGFFLVPAGFRDARPLQTMVSGAELKDAARRISGSAVVCLDCCHAGAILNDRPRPSADANPRLAFLCASRGGEESEENHRVRHGLFTRTLLRALSGLADANRDGVVSLGEVERFIKQRLPKLSRGQQHAVSSRALPPTTPLVRP